MAVYIMSGVAFLLAVWFMLSKVLKFDGKYCALFKLIAGLGFLAVGIMAYVLGQASVKAFVCVLLGLIFGIIGDFMLAMRDVKKSLSENFLFLGIIAFAIGHVFYILLYSTIVKITFYQPTIAIALAIIVIIITKKMKLNYRDMTLPVFLYAFVILFMLNCSITTLIYAPHTVGAIIITVGAALFVVSDTVLCFIYFKQNMPAMLGAVNLTTYFAAQILIALSLFFL